MGRETDDEGKRRDLFGREARHVEDGAQHQVRPRRREPAMVEAPAPRRLRVRRVHVTVRARARVLVRRGRDRLVMDAEVHDRHSTRALAETSAIPSHWSAVARSPRKTAASATAKTGVK